MGQKKKVARLFYDKEAARILVETDTDDTAEDDLIAIWGIAMPNAAHFILKLYNQCTV
jgi:hypothetical protein